ncbi:MAG: tetratricopeptide repeat protein [Cypionkella sp.]
MRMLAFAILVTLAVIVGFSAYAQQSSHARLETGDVEPVLVSQSQTPAAPAITTTPAPATAEPTGPDMPRPAAPATTERIAASDAVDETALRYFARQGDTARMQSELERLRNLHPDWEPPTDLLSDKYVPDQAIVDIWDLFNSGDYAGARAALAAKQAADPSFVPSPDLLDSLALGEAGLRLRNASDAKQYETVITVAANFPDLLTCDSIDNLWRLAEAFASVDNTQRAIDAYSYILSNCDEVPLRFATLQKAADLLDRETLEPLLALERTDAAGLGEFASLRLDLARRAIAASLEDGSAPPLPEDVTLLEQSAESTDNAEDLRLLGWSELARNRNDAGRRWFEAALELDPSAASAQGLGTALLDLGDAETAEATLSDYRDETDEIGSLYLDAAAALLALQPRVELDASVLGRIVEAVMSARRANAAQELGWYAYDFQQPETAVEWFTLALRWQSDLEPAAYGLMVASNALGDAATVEGIRRQWGTRSARIAAFLQQSQSATPPMPQPRPQHQPVAPAQVVQVSQVQPAVQITQAPARPSQGATGSRGCTSFVPAGSLSSAAALPHAWCLMQLNRPAQAVDHFNRALQSGSESTRSDAAYGLSLAYVRLGLADEAAIAAAAAPINDRQVVELEIAILSSKAVSAYNIGDYRRALDALDARARYAPERNDLLTLRAWSYFHIKRYRDSERIFEAVAATGYGDAVAGLQAASAALTAASTN